MKKRPRNSGDRIELSILANAAFGPTGSMLIHVPARGWAHTLRQRHPHVAAYGMTDPKKCPCLSFKILDLYWQMYAPALKPVWDAAVKRPFLSGYQLFMDENLHMCHEHGTLCGTPSPSGGYAFANLNNSGVEVPPAGAWVGKHLPPVAPVAVFTENVTHGPPPLTVNFTDHSTGDITSWAWNFGDTGTSNLPSPTHVYAAVGIYPVTLTVTGPGGSSVAHATKYVWNNVCHACNPPIPDILKLIATGTGRNGTFTLSWNSICVWREAASGKYWQLISPVTPPTSSWRAYLVTTTAYYDGPGGGCDPTGVYVPGFLSPGAVSVTYF